MARQLIVNADDFGRTPGINEGILRAHRDGIVTSTTVMMNMPGANEAVRRVQRESKLGLGVHLVFTAWQPVLPPHEVPSLVDASGNFLRSDVLQQSVQRIDLDELWSEWQAQLALFHALFGKPDHLDCHHFVHIYPPIFETYLRLAEHEGVPARIPFPVQPNNNAEPAAFAARFGLPAEVVHAVLAADRELLRKKKIRHPDHFSGAFFGDENLTLERLLGALDALPDGISELMVHPGLADAALLSSSGYALQRERELELLTHAQVKDRLASAGIELVNYGIFG